MGKKIGKQKNMFRFRLALRQKKVPASLTWWHFSEVLLFFALWFSADSSWQSNAKAKLRQVWSVAKTNVKEHMHVPVQKFVLTQSYDAKILPAASYLDAGRRVKDSGRSVDTYIYRDRKPSQHVTVGLAWGSPQ